MEKKKPKLSFSQIWFLSFGFLGVQFGFALQNANASRILSSLGAHVESLSLFWLVAPTMGLLIQPLVGAASDKTWNRFGRRLPYILGGALVSVMAMFFMPNSSIIVSIMPPIIFGAIMMALMDGSFNVTFQPFRALVADMLPEEQRNYGYSIQSFLINTGAVVGSVLPYIMTNWFDVQNVAATGEVPNSVIWSFYIGGTVLITSVILTIIFTKEYPPKEFEAYNNPNKIKEKKQSIFQLLLATPKTMLQLAVVQFFCWFALFLMWVYTTPAVAHQYFDTEIGDASSEAYNKAGNWVGICFGAYSFFAALFSIAMPFILKKISRKTLYSIALILGGLGYISIFLNTNPNTIIISMIGVGIAWATILAMPYAILSSVLPANRMGIFMGIFNLTVVIPQICSGIFGGLILKHFFNGNAINIILLCGVFMLLGSIAVFFVKDKSVKII